MSIKARVKATSAAPTSGHLDNFLSLPADTSWISKISGEIGVLTGLDRLLNRLELRSLTQELGVCCLTVVTRFCRKKPQGLCRF
jgi:hypothetical protein